MSKSFDDALTKVAEDLANLMAAMNLSERPVAKTQFDKKVDDTIDRIDGDADGYVPARI